MTTLYLGTTDASALPSRARAYTHVFDAKTVRYGPQPAPECRRISPTFLEEERAALGDYWFRQEYLCEFVETEEQLFGYDLVTSAFSDEIQPLFPASP